MKKKMTGLDIFLAMSLKIVIPKTTKMQQALTAQSELVTWMMARMKCIELSPDESRHYQELLLQAQHKMQQLHDTLT